MMIMTGTLVTGMFLQDSSGLSSGNTQLLTIFVAIAAIALLMLGTAFVVLAVVALKLQKKAVSVIDEVKAKAMPIIGTVNGIVQDIAPKVKSVSENVVEMSHVVRDKVQQFDATLTGINETITDVNQKTKSQVSKVDGMVNTALSRTSALADTIHNSIRMPVREVAGVVSGVRAGLDVLMNRAKELGGSTAPRR